MSKITKQAHLEGLKGSSQHHDLKGQPSEKGDVNHAKSSGVVSEPVKEVVKNAPADTMIAQAVKDAVSENE